MIKKFIDRLLGKGGAKSATAEAAAPAATPVIPLGTRTEIPAEQHGIDPKLLDDNAVRVVRTLKDAGHEAYIVGGAVRDLLVGLRPKDFDVATDATPEQVKALFRRAFIIGRRFRLVHVIFGRGREHEVIEVSTFRAYLDPAAAEQVSGNEKTARLSSGAQAEGQHVVDASGRVLRDNVWGPQIEDAARRDFTINAMYYDPVARVVVDYHGGFADVRARVLRMIGDPETRYREDPVRMIRVVRFQAKLGFALDPATAEPIRRMTPLLANVPPSRLFDEMVKLLQTGHAIASVEALKRHGMVGGVFPVLDAVYGGAAPDAAREAFVRRALEDTDTRVQEGRSVVPSYLLACMLWHDVQARWSALKAAGEPPFPALQQAVDAVFEARIGDISGRGRIAGDMREVWAMQPRFERRTPSGCNSLVQQPRFRAGYDFLKLRSEAGEVPAELVEWWEDFHLGSDEEREAMLADLRPSGGAKRRGGGGAAKPRPADPAASAAAEAPSADDASDDEAAEAPAAPAKKRRRRRRKPAGADVPAAPQAE